MGNNELDMIWKKSVVVIFKVVFRNSAGRADKTTKYLSQYRRSPGRDLNRALQNKNRNLSIDRHDKF
jgi:hypothetical protein